LIRSSFRAWRKTSDAIGESIAALKFRLGFLASVGSGVAASGSVGRASTCPILGCPSHGLRFESGFDGGVGLDRGLKGGFHNFVDGGLIAAPVSRGRRHLMSHSNKTRISFGSSAKGRTPASGNRSDLHANTLDSQERAVKNFNCFFTGQRPLTLLDK